MTPPTNEDCRHVPGANKTSQAGISIWVREQWQYPIHSLSSRFLRRTLLHLPSRVKALHHSLLMRWSVHSQTSAVLTNLLALMRTHTAPPAMASFDHADRVRCFLIRD